MYSRSGSASKLTDEDEPPMEEFPTSQDRALQHSGTSVSKQGPADQNSRLQAVVLTRARR